MWQFAIPVLLMEVFVGTLLPSATFSLVTSMACIVTIPAVGLLLDRTNRWTVMEYSILRENFMIVLSSFVLGMIMLVTYTDGIHKPAWTPEPLGLFAAMLVCGGDGQVLNDA
jgi:solute carrier family 40 (iron-regulated transporter), member 1